MAPNNPSVPRNIWALKDPWPLETLGLLVTNESLETLGLLETHESLQTLGLLETHGSLKTLELLVFGTTGLLETKGI